MKSIVGTFSVAGCLLLLLSACIAEPERRFADSPHSLRAPFLAGWEEAEAEGRAPGPPRSTQLWLDGELVQLFAREQWAVALPLPEAGAWSFVPFVASPPPIPMRVTPQPEGWLAAFPADVLSLPGSSFRADLTIVTPTASLSPTIIFTPTALLSPTGGISPTVPLSPSPQSLVASPQSPVVPPLQPLTLTVVITGYTGLAEVRLYDAALQPVSRTEFPVEQGQGMVRILPRGRLGPQWGVVLVQDAIAGVQRSMFTLDAVTTVQTGDPDLDVLYPAVHAFMQHAVVSYTLDGRLVRGYRSPDNPLLWLRDHVYQGRGFRYFERDMTSLLDAFRRAQQPDGSFPDVLTYPALGVTAHRLEPESDLEFLFVQGVYEAWQATGDDAWLISNMDAMRRGLTYSMSDTLRWDAERGLVRRPYTIDMWDFQYGPSATSPDGRPAPRHWIDDQTIWGIFHGDNTGLAYALRLMARIERHLGNEQAAEAWDWQRRELTRRINDLSWNGHFFMHFVPLTGTLNIPGVDTDTQLSLSNAYALNREVLEFQQGRNIVESYYNRRDFSRAFAEWYSIDPPFPPGSFGMGGKKGEQPGEYINGSIMPLVGGELARGAFRYGAEVYGFDILHRYAALVQLTGASYLWYYPTGQAGISGPHTLATDGWGAGAMLGALMEGAAGVEDRSSRYRDVDVSPRWAAAPAITRAYVVARYAASDGYVAYTWERAADGLMLDMTGRAERARIRLLLPDETPQQVTVRVNDIPVEPNIRDVAGRRYVVVEAPTGEVTVKVDW